MKKSLVFFLVGLFFFSCQTQNQQESIEKWKNEILETEQAFAAMAKEEGIHKAFLTYASEEAVLMRNNNLVLGKKAIHLYFENQTFDTNISLTWKPDFVDVSASGDLGYTYGRYIYSFIDSTGKTSEDKGIFHTVWKRQANNSWKFVWD